MGEPDFEQPPSAWSKAPALMPPGAMYTTQDFSVLSYTPALPEVNGDGLAIVGRPSGPTRERCAGALLRHDTRCATCGEGFAKGDIVDVQLADNWDDAKFTHRRCGKPAPRITGHRYRGFGMTMQAQPPEPFDASS